MSNKIEKVFFKIIIPNYNNMPYIKKCLDSILEQTFQDFKIIIVDDLSTDLSDKFCEMYSRKYPDKIAFIKMKYKGHEGGARNTGILYDIQCEYYMFIDGDDFLYNNNCLQILYNYYLKTNSDVIIYKMIKYDTFKNMYIKINVPKFSWNSNNLAIGYSSACGKIIKQNIIEYFLEGCDHAADTYQHLKILNHHPNILDINDIIYVYRKNLNSVTFNGNYKKDTALFYYHLNELCKICTEPNVKKSILHRFKLYNLGKIDT